MWPSLFERFKIGEGAPFVAERGGRQDERGLAALQPPIFMQGPQTGKIDPAQQTPITTQPVDSRMLNQYLALAGFTPKQIQGFAPDIRFI